MKIYTVSCWVQHKNKQIYEDLEYFVDNNNPLVQQTIESTIERMKNKCNAIGYYANHDWSVVLREHKILDNGKISGFGSRLKEINKEK